MDSKNIFAVAETSFHTFYSLSDLQQGHVNLWFRSDISSRKECLAKLFFLGQISA